MTMLSVSRLSRPATARIKLGTLSDHNCDHPVAQRVFETSDKPADAGAMSGKEGWRNSSTAPSSTAWLMKHPSAVAQKDRCAGDQEALKQEDQSHPVASLIGFPQLS